MSWPSIEPWRILINHSACYGELFLLLFSDSDSEEEFEGFAREDITEAERNIEDSSAYVFFYE